MRPGDATQRDLARALGLSQVRVGQIERAAMAKMRLLVFATGDFPLLRDLLGPHLPDQVERDIYADRERIRKVCDRKKRKRWTPAPPSARTVTD